MKRFLFTLPVILTAQISPAETCFSQAENTKLPSKVCFSTTQSSPTEAMVNVSSKFGKQSIKLNKLSGLNGWQPVEIMLNYSSSSVCGLGLKTIVELKIPAIYGVQAIERELQYAKADLLHKESLDECHSGFQLTRLSPLVLETAIP